MTGPSEILGSLVNLTPQERDQYSTEALRCAQIYIDLGMSLRYENPSVGRLKTVSDASRFLDDMLERWMLDQPTETL